MKHAPKCVEIFLVQIPANIETALPMESSLCGGVLGIGSETNENRMPALRRLLYITNLEKPYYLSYFASTFLMQNSELITKIETLVQQERKISTEILEYLIEVQRRRIHIDMGYSSLFTFLTKHLHYSDGSAYRRIEAMKLLGSVPEWKEKISSGEISISTAAKIQKASEAKDFKNGAEKRAFLTKFLGKSRREVEILLAEASPEQGGQELLRQINANESILKIVIRNETREKLEQLRAKLSHVNPKGQWKEVIEILVDTAYESLEKSSTRTTSPRSKGTIRKLIAKRAEYRCEYQDPYSGRRCNSIHFLEIDHIKPRCQGGSDNLENLQLLCRSHNQRKAELQLGKAYMERFRDLGS